MNISASILVLMLLWLIGGSPPVRSRQISSFTPSQHKMHPDAILDSLKNHTTNIEKLIFLEAEGQHGFMKNDAILHNDTKLVKNQNSRTCDERRSLLQIVIDTPIIYEVTVVSKSVAGKLIYLSNTPYFK
jgi:hypothetical protein